MTPRISLGHFLMTVNSATKVVHMINLLGNHLPQPGCLNVLSIRPSFGNVPFCSTTNRNEGKAPGQNTDQPPYYRIQDNDMSWEQIWFLSESEFSSSKHKEGWEVFGLETYILALFKQNLENVLIMRQSQTETESSKWSVLSLKSKERTKVCCQYTMS